MVTSHALYNVYLLPVYQAVRMICVLDLNDKHVGDARVEQSYAHSYYVCLMY